MVKAFGTITGFIAALALTACTVHKAEPPPLTGPSELALALRVSAIPDSISQDGASQTAIQITVLDANGKGKAGVSIRLDMVVGGVVQDFGTLSARTVVTNSEGRASSVYTAPPAPPANLGGSGTRVTIVATPIGGDFQTAVAQSVDIRLVPPGVIIPPADTPTPKFTVTPTPPAAKVAVTFDASSSCPGSADSSGNCLSSSSVSITSYVWNFGDASPQASGRVVSHTFASEGTYNVTLTVTNDRGIAASIVVGVAVRSPATPDASFTFAPSFPLVGQVVVFDASGSTPGVGHTLNTYRWTFDDGTTGAGVTVSHAFAAPGQYNVQLTVTDEAGQLATLSRAVNVIATLPRAAFTFSPAGPGIRQTIFFDASTSTAGQGHTLTSYRWAFGDGTTATGVTTSHAYATAATFLVQLTVTDEAGQFSTTTIPVVVTGSALPIADFVFSPTAPQVNQDVLFDANQSRAAAGRSIVSYSWNFGDGASRGGVVVSHAFATAGTYNVTLVVTDDLGQQATNSKSVTVIVGTSVIVAEFSFSPTDPKFSTQTNTVFFDGTPSRSPSGPIVSYEWDFGDGQLELTRFEAKPSHTFTRPSSYVVKLTVKDATGATATTSKTVTVAP